MKTITQIAIVFFSFLFATSLSAQSFDQQTKILQGGIGLGGWAGTYTSQTPILSVTYEQGLKDQVGPGNIGIGGSLGVKVAKYSGGEGLGAFDYTYTYSFAAIRGAYHPNFAQTEKWDGYAGMSLGAYNLNVDYDDAYVGVDTGGTFFDWGLVLGARYYFTPSIAAYAELGYGMGVLNTGVAYKF